MVLPLTGAAATALPTLPAAGSYQTVSQPFLAEASAPREAAAVSSSADGLDSTLVLIVVALISLPLLVVMALVATVLTRR